ncbi:co-chaperone DjlA [Agaribacter flavus]|uniref:Co-chaperone protein DjlA n=1 Tax=Agaribacter flavus TaxID=1902781 RepID=A0ABV7FSQ6_9ALTE
MGYWGKVIGVLLGMAIFKLPGAILGLIVGHLFDINYARDFSARGGFARFFSGSENMKNDGVFFHALFSALGHIAKADGRVTEQEIHVASRLMDDMRLNGELRKEAQQAFREGKSKTFPLADMLKVFKEHCHSRRDLMQVFLELLIAASCADGHLSKEELGILKSVAKTLGFSQADLQFLISTYEAGQRFRRSQSQYRQAHSQHSSRQGAYARQSASNNLQDAYRILGVNEKTTGKDVKRAYKKLMSQHHPDKLLAKGVPQQALDLAKEKTQDIQSAYALIRESRPDI